MEAGTGRVGPPAARPRDDGLRFSRFIYLPRVFGLALVAVCIGGALWQQNAHPAAWAALFAYTFVWPHVAHPLARASRNPYRAELRNLYADPVLLGAMIASLGFPLSSLSRNWAPSGRDEPIPPQIEGTIGVLCIGDKCLIRCGCERRCKTIAESDR